MTQALEMNLNANLNNLRNRVGAILGGEEAAVGGLEQPQPMARSWESLQMDSLEEDDKIAIKFINPHERLITRPPRQVAIAPIADELIKDPLLCQIRAFDDKLCTVLDVPQQFHSLLDWDMVQAGTPLLDCIVHRKFIIEWVVFWLQNKCGKTKLTLLDIIQHEEPSRWFMAAADLFRREWEGTATDEEWTVVIDYWVNATYLGKESTGPEFLRPPSVKIEPPHNPLHAMVREAMRCKKPEEESVHMLEALLLPMLGEQTNGVFTRIRHARIRYAECLALMWHIRRTKRPSARMKGRLKRVIGWLKQFRAEGCACSR